MQATELSAPGWPEAVDDYLRATHGPVLAVERLGGMSGGQVYRARCAQASLIVKRPAQPAEAHFYTLVAPALRAHGVPIPRLEWSAQAGGLNWLVIEDIALPLPRERWGVDQQVLAALGQLHRLSSAQVCAWPGMFQPRWTEQMTDAALNWFPAAAAQLRPAIEALRTAHQRLFEPECCISGDPNPTNWGVRADGSPVLYDWERFSFGTPALDLAITLPGLGDAAAFERTALHYLRERHAGAQPDNGAVARLARDIAAAKLWSAVEFLSAAAEGALPGAAEATVERIVGLFPAWASEML